MRLPTGPCHGCNAPCCREHAITITSFDALRISENTGLGPSDFATLLPATLLNLNEDTVLECYEGKFRYDYVLALESHPCVFLGNGGLCTIHSFAPYVCRSYPRTSSGKMLGNARCGPLRALLFALCGVSISRQEFSRQLGEYVVLVKRWNSMRGSREECMRFLMEGSRNPGRE